jgi:putative copper export protein
VTPDQLSVVVRAVSLVVLYQAVGATFFLALMDASLSRSRPGIRRLGILSAFAGLVLVLAHQTLDAARLADDFNGLTDGAMLQLAWQSSSGAAHAAQALGLAGVGVGLFVARRGAGLLATAGACLAALALLLTGHSSIHPLRWLLAPLLAIHLLIVGFWFGALAPLYWSTLREPLATAARIVTRFSAVAGWLVPCILVAGLGTAYVLSPDLAMLGLTYGRLLLVKLALFVLLMGLAAYNKWWLTPALDSGDADAAPGLRRVICCEFLLIAGTLAVTAVLTTYYSPEA